MQQKDVIGIWGESHAAKIYSRQGFKILLRNSFNRVGKRLGEIDVIAVRNNLLVFIEVKTRVSTRFGSPEESISLSKQQKLLRSINWFLFQYPEYQSWQLRIDVCAIMLNKLPFTNAMENLDKFIKYSKIITNAVEL